MSLAHPATIHLAYGHGSRFSCEMEPGRLVGHLSAPRNTTRFAEELRTSLANPLDFPAMAQAVIPGDIVCIALDRETPEAALVIEELWRVFERQGVAPEGVRIVQPPVHPEHTPDDPRKRLPEAVRREMSWTIHDPADDSRQAYLASVASGERIYLAREVIDADFVVAVGPMTFDPVIGYRGTNSVYFPGLSNTEAVLKAQGQGHVELGPDDERPLRQMIDEIAWLLGSMFAVQVIPSHGGQAARVLAGASDSVMRLGKHYLAQDWLIETESRSEMVVAGIDADAGGHHWKQVGAALDVARNLVARGGRIIILTDLDRAPGEGIRLLERSDSPADALGAIREASPADLLEATQLCNALEWADVYFLSRLESDLVEDLFMIPLENEREVARLLERDETCVLLESAQHAFGRIAD